CWAGGTKSVGLDLTVLPDEDFVLRYTLAEEHAPGVGNGGVEATVHFSGVPSSAQLVSCHGANDVAVATQRTTCGLVTAWHICFAPAGRAAGAALLWCRGEPSLAGDLRAPVRRHAEA